MEDIKAYTSVEDIENDLKKELSELEQVSKDTRFEFLHN